MFDSTGSHQKIRHPGPPAEQRIQWVQGQVQSATVRLPGGTPLTQAVAMAMHRLQGETAFFQLDGLQLRSGNHVLPAASVDGQHVAWYSDTKPMGACTFLSGTVVVGRKDDDWFLHCHALWKTAQGTLASGMFCARMPASPKIGTPPFMCSKAAVCASPTMPKPAFRYSGPVRHRANRLQAVRASL